MSGLLTYVFLTTLVAYVSLGSFLCLLIAAELAFPSGPLPSWPERWKAIQFTLIFVPAFVLCMKLADVAVWSFGHTPPINLRGGAMPLLIVSLAYLFIADFFYYWFHRAQHAVPWLWKFHAVHHSNEHLSAGYGYHHLAEAPLRAALAGIPLGLLVARPNSGALITFILMMHGYYIHSSSRLNFGRLAWVITDNRVHRIHHSLEPRHFNKNFGVTLIWDRVFKTAYFPEKDECPAVGLEGHPEPKSVREYITYPIRRSWSSIAATELIARRRR